MSGLTAKQQRFVQEYMVDLNATQAAIRAGYSKKTAGQVGFENLRKPEIQKAIEAGQKARSKRTGITADAVLTELGRIAFANMGDYLSATGDGDVSLDFTTLEKADLSSVTKFTQKHIAAGDGGLDVVETKFELASKVRALKLLGDHLGLFKTAEKDMVSGLADALSRARRRVDDDMRDTG